MLERLKARWINSRLEIVGSALILVSLGLLVLVAMDKISGAERDVALSFATGALGGGVFTWLTKLLQISGVIREELESVVYGVRHLKTRADKEVLWQNVTRALYGDRFPDLRDKITSDALKNVLPSQRRFYVRSGKRSISIRLLDKATGLVEIHTTFDAELITDSGNDEVLRESTWTFRESAVQAGVLEAQIHAQKSRYQLLTPSATGPFKPEIEDEPQKPEAIGSGELRVRYLAKLKPSSKYRVQVDTKETQILGEDNVIGFAASSYIDGLIVHLKTGSGLTTQFHPQGQAKFDECPETNGDKCWEIKDLLFSDAGYLISIQLVP